MVLVSIAPDEEAVSESLWILFSKNQYHTALPLESSQNNWIFIHITHISQPVTL